MAKWLRVSGYTRVQAEVTQGLELACPETKGFGRTRCFLNIYNQKSCIPESPLLPKNARQNCSPRLRDCWVRDRGSGVLEASLGLRAAPDSTILLNIN